MAVGDYEGYIHWLNADDGSIVARNAMMVTACRHPGCYDGTLYVLGYCKLFAYQLTPRYTIRPTFSERPAGLSCGLFAKAYRHVSRYHSAQTPRDIYETGHRPGGAAQCGQIHPVQSTTCTRILVADFGLTRDRKYGDGRMGITCYRGRYRWQGENEDGIDAPMTDQSPRAVGEADLVLFMVDGRAGLTAADEIAGELRKLLKPTYLVVNKTDGIYVDIAMADFYALGMSDVLPIAAAHGRGVRSMIETVMEAFPDLEPLDPSRKPRGPGRMTASVWRCWGDPTCKPP